MSRKISRLIARLILFTPIGDIPGVCTLHWWAIRRFPRFFGLRAK